MTAIVSLSGGMDSTAALSRALATYRGEVRAVSIDYGQRHRTELEHAASIAHALDVPHQVLRVGGLHGSALLDGGDVPHGHYAAETMTATVVQGRNLLFIAHLVALTQPGDQVWVGVHAGDHFIYPDCRPEFILPLGEACYAYGVDLVAPWLHVSKAAILTEEPDAPYHLSWSCYEGGAYHCGRCGTCVERAEAFALAGMADPTTYVDTEFWRTAAP